MRVMLFGSRLEAIQQGKPTAHGQTFWLEMIPAIIDKVDQLLVASIGGRPSQGIGSVQVMRILPFPLQLLYAGDCQGNDDLEDNYIVKTALFAGAYRRVQELVEKWGIDVIHLIENYGPIQAALSRVEVAKSIFQLHYDPRYPMYDELLRLSLRPFDAIITGSQAVAAKLRELRVAPSAMIRSIPWGVPLDAFENHSTDRADVRSHFGLDPNAKIVLWTGFISTVVRIEELLFSLEVAKKLVDEFADVVFVFAFKRQQFDRRYEQFEKDRVKVLSLGSRTEFLRLASVSSLLFSPCLNRRAILGPPLTWLECMAQGVPVVTTGVAGVDEILQDDKNGIVVQDADQVANRLRSLLRDHAKTEQLGRAAKETVRQKFGIEQVADAYLQLWSSLV